MNRYLLKAPVAIAFITTVKDVLVNLKVMKDTMEALLAMNMIAVAITIRAINQ
jgi:hypothetical protein